MTSRAHVEDRGIADDARDAYALPTYPFCTPPELLGAEQRRYPLVIVGAGLAGLTLACEFASRGIEAVVLDEDDTVGVRGASSRAICYAQKSLEIFARLGVYERIRARGVQWSVGRTMAGDDEVYCFDLAREAAQDASLQPPFINLQQFHVEGFLVERIAEFNSDLASSRRTDLRWKSKVVACTQDDACVTVAVETPEGNYAIEADWVVDCSGCHSAIRAGFGLAVNPAIGIDRWCISDVRFAHTPPAERWTWIEAPFNQGRAVWQHLMGDGVWRLDYQMDAGADLEAITRPEVVAERLRRHFGPEVEFKLIWVGPYSYRSQMLEDFRHGRVLFAGDAAHVMSPFGARGGNSGIQDAENLAWKLALVIEERVPPENARRLLDSYSHERAAAARENIRHTDRTNRFLTPHSPLEKLFRDAVIALAKRHAFARGFVNTGRLSVASAYSDSPLSSSAHAGRALQNIVLKLPDGRNGDLVSLLRWAGMLPLVVVFGSVAQAMADGLCAIERRFPMRVVACADDGELPTGAAVNLPAIGDRSASLARLCAIEGRPAFALIRPDLHLAATLALTLENVEHAVRRVLAWD